jgi:pilus assembly protein CpaB
MINGRVYMDAGRGVGFKAKKANPYIGLIILNGACVAILLVLGVAYVFLKSDSSEANQQPAPVAAVVTREPTIPMVDVLIPVRNIEAGEPLSPALFRRESRPESAVSDKVVRDIAEVGTGFARAVIMSNEPLNRDYITNQRPLNQITTNIPDGFRAVTVSVDVKTGVEGWARAGARVDVGWTTTISGKAAFAVISQNALVLSAERQLNSNQDPALPVPTTITLLVNTRDSAKIQLATTTGLITLSLRGDRDSGRDVGFNVIAADDLTGKTSADGSEAIEGIVRFKDPRTGKYKELVVKGGQVMKRN